jgi:phytoene/squalene synthetase
MCLQVFCAGHKEHYEDLETYARSLGAAFQKVNFLRDLRADFEGLDKSIFRVVISITLAKRISWKSKILKIL